jgi:hypothetical protein
MNPVILVQSWRKHHPDQEENDLPGFPNDEIGKYDILNMACAMNFENTNEDNTEERLQSDVCERCFQQKTDMDTVNATAK